MKKYSIKNKAIIKVLPALLTVLAASCILSCQDEFVKNDSTNDNLSMAFTRSGEVQSIIIPNMRIFSFNDNAQPNNKHFYKEVLNLTRNAAASTISTQVEVGNWHLSLVAPPTGTTLTPPVTGTVMAALPMYTYTPTYSSSDKKSTDAAEIYMVSEQVSISASPSTLNTRLDRNVAKVELIINKATSNFNKTTGTHKFTLADVPTTISYTGKILPTVGAPSTTSLEAAINLKNHGTENGFLCSDTVKFIIPAHREDNLPDTIKKFMELTVELQRTGGSTFKEKVTIPRVARYNKILRVLVNVNDGLLVNTEVLPWLSVEQQNTVGKGYANYLYVKQGITGGSGMSWSDPASDISTAVETAKKLLTDGKTVHGILVAGGSSLQYTEANGLEIPAGIKIFGGWEGTPGTELLSTDGPSAVYASTNRHLSTHKAYLSVGTKNVSLTADNTVLDGFIISGAGSGTALVNLSNATAWLNAIEIDQQTNLASTYALSVSNGVATNVLSSRNNKGVAVTGSGKLVNATITNNTTASTFSGTLLNSIYWGNSGTVTTTGGTINYCAFQGTAPAGTNYPLNSTNNAWFTNATISVPGPHFNQTASASVPYYAVNVSTPNRGPQLARGDQSSFDNVTAIMLDANKQDISGNPRHHNGTDIGCYESTGVQKGFEFRWNMTDIFISPKVSIESDHLALLFDNSEGAYVQWEATDFIINSGRYSVVTGTTSGSGNMVNLGSFKLKSSATANSGNADLECGSLVFKCKNIDKSYFPDVPMMVYQSPAKPAVWNEGYAGSFHKWNETGPRYIIGEHLADEDWVVRIISGHDWIKIDGKSRPSDPYNDTEVEETFGGVVKGKGTIIFRIGMKSILTSATSQPRYGLISITKRIKDYSTNTWTNNRGSALFFVRQGEAADYLYRPGNLDPRALGSRTEAIKFSPYNLSVPSGTSFNASGNSLGKNGGRFVDYPSKTGYFFKWNSYVAYYPDNSITGTSLGSTSNTGSWNDANEPCPAGYFTPTDAQFVHSYFLNRAPANGGSGSAKGTTFVWGRLADGYFDKIAGMGERTVGTGPNRATEGLLMYNDYTNASVFFPMAGYRSGTSFSSGYIQWTQTSSVRSTNMWHTHSYGSGNDGHLGMACTQRSRSDGLSVRCVKAQD